MKIGYLADYPDMFCDMCELLHQEFSPLAPGRTKDEVMKKMASHMSRKTLPLTLIAMDDHVFMGTASLRQFDLSTHTQYTPWLASVAVQNQFRKQGVGRQLVQAVENEAKKLGFLTIFCFTPTKSHFYAKMGWTVIEQSWFNNSPCHVMKKNLKICYSSECVSVCDRQ